MRLVIADCCVDYSGRLSSHLPRATRLLMSKGDGSVLIHSEGGSYKPLNWMSPPCTLTELQPSTEQSELGAIALWRVRATKTDDQIDILIFGIVHESVHALGVDPGLQKDGVEWQLQKLLAEHIEVLGAGYQLIRREHQTVVGPVDILAKDEHGATVAIELKRRGEIDGVEQLSRYLEFLNRDPLISPVSGIFAAQEIRPQARALAEDRGIRCFVLDYDELRGIEPRNTRLF